MCASKCWCSCNPLCSCGLVCALAGWTPFCCHEVLFLLRHCLSHTSATRTMRLCLLEFWVPLHKVSGRYIRSVYVSCAYKRHCG